MIVEDIDDFILEHQDSDFIAYIKIGEKRYFATTDKNSLLTDNNVIIVKNSI